MKGRWALSILLLVVMLTSLPALQWLELLSQRECYRLLEMCRVIEGGGSYWGQIALYNVPNHPEWMRTCVRVVSATTAYAIVLALPIAAVATTVATAGARGTPGALKPWAWPCACAALTFGLALAVTYDRVDHWVYEGMYDVADAMGCQYTIISGARPIMFESGPFHGGTAADLLNWFYMHAWYKAPLIPPLLAASTAFLLNSPRRRFGHDDVCSACGYSLRGLSAGAVCPECGSRRVLP